MKVRGVVLKVGEGVQDADRRIHAMRFGQFYLEGFADPPDWEEAKEAFQDWNLDKGFIFGDQAAKDFDPDILSKAVEIAKVLADYKKG